MSLRVLAVLMAFGGVAGTAQAADPNYAEMFRTRALKCIHSTVNPDKATVEVTRGPTTLGDVTTVRLKTFYEGLVRKNVMESEVMIRQAGSIRQWKVNTLADSGTGGHNCALEKNWTDF